MKLCPKDLVLQFEESDLENVVYPGMTIDESIKMVTTETNKLLRDEMSRWPVVRCHLLKESNLTDEHGPGWTCAEESTRIDNHTTHRSRIAPPQPIVKESAEDVLRDLVKHHDGFNHSRPHYESLIERARKVLK